MSYELALIGGKLCDGFNIRNGNIYISEEKIKAITPCDVILEARQSYDCSGFFVFPGFIDPHVHLNLDLGKYISSDNYETASDAALSDGVTTFFDFTEPVRFKEDFEKVLEDKFLQAKKSKVDYGLHFTLGENQGFNAEEIASFTIDHGIPSVKIFTAYGDSKRRTDRGFMYELFRLSSNKGFVVLVHSEDDELIRNNMRHIPAIIDNLSRIRSTESELVAVLDVLLLAQLGKGQVYIVHLSSGKTLEELHKLKNSWSDNVVIETCPQYLLLDNSRLKGEENYLFSFCPPLRSEGERDKLLEFLKKGRVQTIGTDHCPFSISEKIENAPDLNSIPYGLPTLGFTFSLMRSLISDPLLLARLLSVNPAKYLGLFPEKGSLIPGTDADLVVIDMDKEWTIGTPIFGKAEYSPYHGLAVKGKIAMTFLRGELAYNGKEITLASGAGRFIKRNPIHWGD
ncbi:MAG: amidohydrolase family protein [Kosmotoga sp.]|uniref:dihydroorotase n=1 Tax=Kosmotoga sp. TaxID=1955248 RepID=UPI001D3176D9|nr:amidohydrolase family protein [Kosmotoga sp.]MBO8166326.1 amidohydrolase family protein [Kosmotoga sp.]